MDTCNQTPDTCADPALSLAGMAAPRPMLGVVSTRFQLAHPPEPRPDDWRIGTELLLEWLRVDADFVAAGRAGAMTKMASWALPPAATSARGVPVFAPWLCWSPTALQHGGHPTLPKANWTASYLLDCGAGPRLSPCGIDVVLMSPLPAACAAHDADGIALPRADVLKAMIRAAKVEGREKLAIIVNARQRNAVARQLMIADRALTRDGIKVDILTIEDALRPLMDGPALWDAIIAMPDVRSIVFAMLSETSGVRGPWPMLWHGPRQLQLITSEGGAEGISRVPLDAPTLIHGLALSLRHAGCDHAAWRLHAEWARLRDSGVTTPGRGSIAPYVSQASDADFITMLVRDLASSKRPVRGWRTLGDSEQNSSRPHAANLRVVASNSPTPVQSKRSL